MSEPSLVAILQRERGALERALRARDPLDALSPVREFLDGLPDAYATDAARDTDGRVRDIVEAVRAGVAATRAVQLIHPAPERPRDPAPRRGTVLGAWGRAARETPEAYREARRGPARAPAPAPASSAAPRLEVDAVRLVDALEEALEAADRVLEPEPAPAPSPPAAAEWAVDDDLVDLLHDLLSARVRGNAAELWHRLSLLEQELALRHDITAVTFDGENDERFEFLAHPDPSEKDRITRRPALVTSERLIRRGEVRVPADELSRQHGRQETWPELPTP